MRKELFLVRGGFLVIALLIAQHGLTRKLDLVAFFADAFHEVLLPFLQFVPDIADPPVGDFRNMQQTVGAGKDLNKGSEIDDAADGADIGLSDFGFSRQAANTVDGGFCGGAVSSRDGNRAVVLDVDFRARLFDQRAYDFSTWSNDV